MTDDHNDHFPSELLDAWDVAPPSPGLTDRILARSADALADLRAPSFDAAASIDPEPLEATAMQPTDNVRSLRPFLTTALIAAAAAAALLLAFVAGRSTTPEAVKPAVPNVRIEVAAPSPTAPTPAPIETAPTPEAPPAIAPEQDAVSPSAEAQAAAATSKRHAARRRTRPTSADLKNPFADDDDKASPFEGSSAPVKDPFATDKPGSKATGVQGVMPSVIACVSGTGSWRVKTEFVLSSTGRVVRVRQLDDTLSSRDWACAEKALRKARFEATGETEVRDMTLSFESAVQDGADSKPKKKKKTSVLRIGTESGVASAQVRVDGRPMGTTPLARVQVTPGTHRVQFTWPDGRTMTKVVHVRDGAAAVVRGG
ncbi:MAG: PEGA domain-containing protein [Myxococcota bacterium]